MSKLLDENSLLAIKQFVENHAIWRHVITGNSETLIIWWPGHDEELGQGDYSNIVDGINDGSIKFICASDGHGNKFDLESVSKDDIQFSMTFTFTDNTSITIYEQDIVEYGGDVVTML